MDPIRRDTQRTAPPAPNLRRRGPAACRPRGGRDSAPPDAAGRVRVTYAELRRQADDVAAALRPLVCRDALVAILLPRDTPSCTRRNSACSRPAPRSWAWIRPSPTSTCGACWRTPARWHCSPMRGPPASCGRRDSCAADPPGGRTAACVQRPRRGPRGSAESGVRDLHVGYDG